MKTKINKLFLVFISIFLSLMLVNAAQDFTVSPASIAKSLSTAEASSGTITITNSGTEPINLTFSKTNLISGSNSITLNIDQNSVTNLAVGSSVNLDYSFTAGSIVGTFTGTIITTNTNNGSQIKSIPVSVVISSTADAPSVTFDGEGTTLTMDLDVDDNSESKTFTLLNNGNAEIFNIEIDLDDLDGDDDTIGNDDIEINGVDADRTFELNEEEDSDFSLAPGEDYSVRFKINIPSNLDVDDYKGDLDISFTVANGTRYTKSFSLKVVATSEDEEIYFENNLYVRNGILEVTGKPGDTIDDIEISIKNDASYDVEEITIELDDDLEEEDSSNKILKSDVEFFGSPLSIDERDSEEIDVEITIPEGTPTGTYLADIDLYNQAGKKKDTIQLKVKVVGDIYVKEIKFPESVKPGDVLDLEVIIKNEASKTFRNVKITGIIFDIDFGNSDIQQSTSTFILDGGKERTEKLRFSIPKEAKDGSHTLELRITYDNLEVTEIEEINVERPINNMVIDSYMVNPGSARCQKELYTFIRFKNLGKFDRDVVVSAEIEGTNIKKSTSSYRVNVDSTSSESINLDISSLEEGKYDIIHKITYGSGLVVRETSQLTVLKCSETSVDGIDIEDTTNTGNQTQTDDRNNENKVELFGQQMDKTTAYLAGGVGIIFVVILVVAIFLL